MNRPIDPFDLFEIQAKAVGLSVETSEVWTYGEGYNCGCKWMVLRQVEIIAHCRTLVQVERVIKAERQEITPLIKAHQTRVAESDQQLKLW